jgi:hypothetical protein
MDFSMLCESLVITNKIVVPASASKMTKIQRAQFFPLNRNQQRTQLTINLPMSFASGDGNQLSIESTRTTAIIETMMLLADRLFICIPNVGNHRTAKSAAF